MGYITADQVLPGYNSKAEDWISWYELIPGGKSTRNPIWLQAWAKWGGLKSPANTPELRAYMSKNAGISITTDGLGRIVDTTNSALDSISDVAMLPVYAVAIGSVIMLGLTGSLLYLAYKNPETTARLAKAAILANGGPMNGVFKKRNLYLMGAASVVLVSLVVFFYYRNKNQLIISNIMAAIVKSPDPIIGSGTGSYGDTRDLGNSQIFNPGYWKTVPASVTLPVMKARELAKQIWEAKSTSDLSRLQIRDYPEKVVAVFKSLKTKADVSKLADSFEIMYKTPLYSFIDSSFMTGNCGPDQNECYFGISSNYLKQIYDWIKNQLT